MVWRRQVEQWRQAAIWESAGLPPDLLLSIIAHESGGFAGISARVRTKYARELPTKDGKTKTVDRALGLMQCIPTVILDYNKAHPASQVFYEDMAGFDADDGRAQIRVGAWLLSNLVRRLHRLYPEAYPAAKVEDAQPEQLTAALVAYARGLGALKDKLDTLKSEGKPLTQAALYERFPLWGYDKVKGQWTNRPLYYAANVWRNYERHRENDPGSWPPPNPSGQPPESVIAKAPKKKKVDLDFGVPILILVGAIVASKFFGKGQ